MWLQLMFYWGPLSFRDMIRSAGCIRKGGGGCRGSGCIESLLRRGLRSIRLNYTIIFFGARFFKNRIKDEYCTGASCGYFEDSYMCLHFCNVSHSLIPNKRILWHTSSYSQKRTLCVRRGPTNIIADRLTTLLDITTYEFGIKNASICFRKGLEIVLV